MISGIGADKKISRLLEQPRHKEKILTLHLF